MDLEIRDETFAGAVGAPAVPGLVIRRLRRPDDYPAMNDIANAGREALGMAFTTTVDQMQEYYDTATRFDPDRDVAVFELDGRIAGYARTGANRQTSGLLVYEIVAFIDPRVDAARIYPTMLTTLEAHARSLSTADPPGPKAIETPGGDDAPELEQIVRAAGYDPIRHSYTMVRAHVDDLPDADLPAGLEIRPVRPEDVRKIWDAGTEAFRDAWGFVEPDEADFERFLTDPTEMQTDLWRVAWDGDEVAGQVRGYINAVENERFGRRRGYTESISVRRPWRRRGVARALIGATIRALRERGMTEVALGVDTENVTGALQLYESCGYVPVKRQTQFRKPLE